VDGLAATTERPAASTDDALVQRARKGDAAAFDALVASRLDRCYRLAWSILLNDADAADATQEAFVAAWRQLPRLRDSGAFDGWLNRIVANAARMSRRHRIRLREVQVRPVEAGSGEGEPPSQRHLPPDTPSDFDRVLDADAIGRAFDRLRDHERLVLTLHYVEERPVAEIARTLGVPVGTAKWRLHSARRALEQAMEVEA
jgi:RNA polymerase sigma-70 factor, ECF subfamily